MPVEEKRNIYPTVKECVDKIKVANDTSDLILIIKEFYLVAYREGCDDIAAAIRKDLRNL